MIGITPDWRLRNGSEVSSQRGSIDWLCCTVSIGAGFARCSPREHGRGDSPLDGCR